MMTIWSAVGNADGIFQVAAGTSAVH